MEYTPVKTQINYSKLENSELDFYGVKKRRIFHYTSIRGLEGILGHRKLHFTNIKYMNDKDEIIAGVESMAKISKDSEKMTEMLRSDVINPGTQTFVCCFSLDEDSLPMWNYYTKEINNQGYNIEFDDRKLAESILRNNSALDGCALSFGMVYYSKNNDSAFSKIIVDEILTALNLSVSKLFSTVSQGMLSDKIPHIDESLLKDWKKKIDDTERKSGRNNLSIYYYDGETCSFEKNPFGNYLYFIKRSCFKQEREFRIVITVPDEKLINLKEKGVYKFRVGNGILIPYLELDFSPEVVKSITISPTVQSDLVEISIRDFLTYCGFETYDCSGFIKHSNVPVRF